MQIVPPCWALEHLLEPHLKSRCTALSSGTPSISALCSLVYARGTGLHCKAIVSEVMCAREPSPGLGTGDNTCSIPS